MPKLFRSSSCSKVLLIVAGAAAVQAAAQPAGERRQPTTQTDAAAPSVGSPIVDYIAALRRQGVNVIFSDALLPPTLLVRRPPTGDTPLAKLRSVLADHGLALEAGPRRSWLVVEGSDARGAAAPPRPQEPVDRSSLETVVVSASRYEFTRSTATSTQRLQRAQMETLPTLGDDALRATHTLPGLASTGLSARVNVRGGEADESLMLIDGVRLYNPFHLKDFQSLFSSISPRILESVEVRTGGFPAEFGDRMSAVVEMQSFTPAEPRRHEVAVSTLSTSILSSGRFAGGRGEWLTSLRRGNLDVLADAANSDIGTPQYTDFYTKFGFEFRSGWAATAGTLILNDKISLADAPEAIAGADYDDAYVWLRVDRQTDGPLDATYLLSHARLGADRNGVIADPDSSFGELDEARRFVSDTLKADWSLELGDKHLLRWGAQLDDTEAEYEFSSATTFPAPIRVEDVVSLEDGTAAELSVDGRELAAYAAYRVRPLERLTAELGLRWDEQSHLDDSQLSPRVHVLLDTGERSTLRASWGRFFQTQHVGELQVADGLPTFAPAQEAEHLVLGFERFIGQSAVARVEIYRKEFEQLRPRFENLFHRVSLLPELLPDRVLVPPRHAEATGLELAVEGENGPWLWWANLSRATAEDVLADGRHSRSWEEAWSVKGGGTWTGPRWTVTLAATASAGRPITSLTAAGGELVAGDFNAQRFGDFKSFDVKATRKVELERAELEWFLELTNLLGSENPCCIEYSLERDAAGRIAAVDIETTDWLPTVPSVGFLLEF